MDFDVPLNLQSVGIVHGKSMSKVAMVLAVNHNLESENILSLFLIIETATFCSLVVYRETTRKALYFNAEKSSAYDR